MKVTATIGGKRIEFELVEINIEQDNIKIHNIDFRIKCLQPHTLYTSSDSSQLPKILSDIVEFELSKQYSNYCVSIAGNFHASIKEDQIEYSSRANLSIK